MKKRMSTFTKISLLVISALFVFSSCTDDKTEEIWIDNPTEWKVFDITVNKSQWQWEDGQDFGLYFCSKNVPELTTAIAERGGIIIDRVIDNSFYRRLPITEYLYANPPLGYYAQTIDFEYGDGWIDFNIKQSDLYDNTPVDIIPDAMTFKVTIFYNR